MASSLPKGLDMRESPGHAKFLVSPEGVTFPCQHPSWKEQGQENSWP